MKKKLVAKIFIALLVSICNKCSDEDNQFSSNQKLNRTATTESRSSFSQFMQHPVTQTASAATWFVATKTWQSTKYLAKKAYQTATQNEALKSNSIAKKNDYESDTFSVAGSDSSSNSEHFDFIHEHVFFRDQLELQQNLINSPLPTIIKLNTTMKKCYEENDPSSNIIQEDLAHIFALLKESTNEGNKTLSLDPVIADEYNAIQRKILVKKVANHAQNIIPAIQAEYKSSMSKATQHRDNKIKRAHEKFAEIKERADTKLQKKTEISLRKIKRIAANSDFINHSAPKKLGHSAHDKDKFESRENYLNYLAEIREQSTGKAK